MSFSVFSVLKYATPPLGLISAGRFVEYSYMKSQCIDSLNKVNRLRSLIHNAARVREGSRSGRMNAADWMERKITPALQKDFYAEYEKALAESDEKQLPDTSYRFTYEDELTPPDKYSFKTHLRRSVSVLKKEIPLVNAICEKRESLAEVNQYLYGLTILTIGALAVTYILKRIDKDKKSD